MSKHPDFKPGKSVTLQFGDEVLNGDIHWRNTLLEILLYTDYGLDYIAKFLESSLVAILLVIDKNDPCMLILNKAQEWSGCMKRLSHRSPPSFLLLEILNNIITPQPKIK